MLQFKHKAGIVGILIAAVVVVIVFIDLSNAPEAAAQTEYKLGGKEATITLNGTSTLHDWVMTAHTFACDAQFNATNNGKLAGITSLSLTLPVANLKSESDGLNDNAYKALKSDIYKNIIFVMTTSKITSSLEEVYKITVWGNLTIAGVMKPVGFYLQVNNNADGSISCTGSLPLKMSTYDIERPSFLLGAMKAGDALTLKFDLGLVK
ncbi:MAG: YceI family protein [Ignavibacteriota bacterium]